MTITCCWSSWAPWISSINPGMQIISDIKHVKGESTKPTISKDVPIMTSAVFI